MRHFSVLLALFALPIPLRAAEPAVKILSVEPAGTPLNPDGRLWLREHPARFWVRVENASRQAWAGYLQGGILGNLDTVYGLPRERVALGGQEKRALSVVWDYPPDTAFTLSNGVTRTLPGPSWGHEIRVRLEDEAGRVLATGSTTFAVGHDGLPAPEKPLRATRPLGNAREAFLLRYSGYLRNPAFTPAPPGSLTASVPGLPAEAGLGGHYYVLDFGPYLVDRGFVVIAPDNERVGERYDRDTQSPYGVQDLADRDPAWSSLAQNLHDQRRCLDYLQTLPYVEGRRIGCIGHSLGGQNAIVLENDPDGKLQAVFPINGGSRNWALYAGDRDENINIPGEEPPGETWPGRQYARPIQLATIKYGLLPLDLVKDWALEFKDPPGVVFPHIYATAADLPAIRKRIAETPVLKKHVDQLAGSWNSYRAQQDPDYPYYKNWVIYFRGLDNVYLATGDESYAKDAAELLIARLRYYVHQTHAGVGVSGYRWSHGYEMFHLTTGPLPICLRAADIVLGSPSVTPEQKRQIRALLAFWGALFASRDYAPPGYNHGNTDMVVSLYMVQGAIGSVLNGHPRAKDWAKVCYDGLSWALQQGHHLPGPSQDEWYGSYSLEMAVEAGMILKRAGFYDLFQDPRLRDGLDFYGQLTVPYDSRNKGGYIVPYGNGQECYTRSVVWADAASAVAKEDPAFAGRMMWYWNRCGQPGSFRIGADRADFGWVSLGWVDPTIPAENPRYASKYLPGWGAIFRCGCGTPQETFMALQLGKPAGLGGYNAEGGFHLVAQGQPLCLIFGLRSWDAGVHKGAANGTLQRWLANRPSFDYRSENEGGTGGLLEWSSCSRADLASGEWKFLRLVEYGPLGPPEGPDRLELSKPRPHDDSVQIGFTKESVPMPRWGHHLE